MKSKSSLLVSVIALALTAVIILCYVLSNLLPVNSAEFVDTYTICDDGDYYSETTYYFNEAEYKKSVVNFNSRKNLAVAAVATSARDYESDNEVFVSAVQKNVWVNESVNDEGVTTQSRLLKKSEIEDLQKYYPDSGILLSSATNPGTGGGDNGNISSGSSVTPPKPNPNKFVGDDTTSKYLLTIDMNVYYNTNTERYTIEGNASWEAKLVWAWQKEEAAEEYDCDFMGITWGGERNLCSKSESMVGVYYDNNAVECSKTDSDSYAGMLWSFHEKSGWMGKELRKGTATVVLARVGELMNKQTNAKLTYIHTFGEIDSTLKISYDKNGLAGSIEMSKKDNSWQLQIDVPEIYY